MARRAGGRPVAMAAAGAVALMAGVFGPGPGSAAAADAAPRVAVRFDQHQISIGTEPPNAELVYRLKVTGGPAHDVTLTFDLSGVTGFAVPAPSQGCTGTVCTVHLATTTKDFHILTLLPAPGAKAGASGTVTVSGTAADATVSGDSTTVTNGRPELRVTQSPDELRHKKPGDTLTFPIDIWNRGILPAAKGVELRVDTTAGLRLTGSWANCRDVPVGSGRRKIMAHETLCDFPAPAQAGARYKLSSPLRLTLGSNAFQDMISYAVTPLTDAAAPNGPGTALTLVPDGSAPSTGEAEDSYAATSVYTDNHADFAVTGDSVAGRRGGHATLRATVTNLGPALVEDLDDSEAALWVSVTLPPGTKSTKIPQGCNLPPTDDGTLPSGPLLGRSAYVCYLSDHPAPGQSFALSFTVAIGSHAPAVARGRIATQEIYRDLDPVASNNSAALTLQVAQGGTEGGSAASGGTAAGGAATGGAASGGVASSGGTAASGSLADTGFGGGFTVPAAALVLVGGAAVVVARRSRAARGRR